MTEDVEAKVAFEALAELQVLHPCDLILRQQAKVRKIPLTVEINKINPQKHKKIYIHITFYGLNNFYFVLRFQKRSFKM